jgi:hypothetical protein
LWLNFIIRASSTDVNREKVTGGGALPVLAIKIKWCTGGTHQIDGSSPGFPGKRKAGFAMPGFLVLYNFLFGHLK